MTTLFRNQKILFALIIFVLLVVEIFFSFWTENPYDMKVWFQTGIWMKQGINIYIPDNHIGYPPMWALWCLAAYDFYSFLGSNMEVWRFFIKLPMIIAQFALAFAVWNFAKNRFNTKTAGRVFLFTVTCSFFIFVGAFWGQINILSALLTFLAFYAVTSKRFTTGAIILGLAVALKIYPLIILPAFLVYIFRNQNWKETGKFALYTCAVPVVFTFSVFAAYQWDILYFFKTIFYWAPIYDVNPLQFQGGCMNIWSFTGLMGLDISSTWILRFIWIPLLAAATIYWFRKRRISEAQLNLFIISLYLLFMVSYSWVTEQTFLDPLPFIFLQILAYRPKLNQLYALAGIQFLVYTFALFNGAPMIFEPLFARFYPALVSPAQNFGLVNSALSWTVRGIFGLVISASLAVFLLFLIEPTSMKRNLEKIGLGLVKAFHLR